MHRESRTDGFTAIEDRFAGYEVYDRSGEKIGKVDDLFVDEADRPEYIGVKMGFLGTRSTLIPWEAVSSTDDEGKAITVATDKDTAKDGPAFDDDREITPEFENEVHSYYGLGRSTEEQGAYSDYYDGETNGVAGNGTAGPGMTMGDREGGRFYEHTPGAEGVSGEGREDLEDEDELRVQRSEEELRAGTREREAGALRVRKRVRTDRELIEVPTRHEEYPSSGCPSPARPPRPRSAKTRWWYRSPRKRSWSTSGPWPRRRCASARRRCPTPRR